MTHVYTRERHENKNTRFWATMHLRPITILLFHSLLMGVFYMDLDLTGKQPVE